MCSHHCKENPVHTLLCLLLPVCDQPEAVAVRGWNCFTCL